MYSLIFAIFEAPNHRLVRLHTHRPPKLLSKTIISKMRTNFILGLFFLCFFFSITALNGQEYLDINTKHRCIFHGNEMDEELYSFDSEIDVMDKLVERILQYGGDLKQNFVIRQTNVTNVAAIVDGDKRYLLWSQDFIDKANYLEAFASVAHEVGHLINEHTFKTEYAKKESAEADIFMGFILAKAQKNKYSKQDIITYFKRKSTSSCHRHSSSDRIDNILKGFKQAEDHLKIQSGGGWDGDPSLKRFLNASFPFPPPQCHTSHELPYTAFSNCNNLGQVAKKISTALSEKDYPNRFMSVPNGFAIVTQMEQYSKDGSILYNSQNRWTEMPPHESFSLSWDYFKTLIYPRKGQLRLFVFIVTKQNYNSDERKVSKEEAVAWLGQAVNRLPQSIATESFNGNYSISALVYEFEVPESNYQAKQSCPTLFQAKDHLRLSGLLENLQY